jgi:histidine triad (HIT) family protein
MTPDCIFCRIANREVPATVVLETTRTVAFRDQNPQAPVHVLVIPRAHVGSLADATDPGVLGDVLASAAQVARDEGIEESGYRVVLNTNADGGQSVSHLHAHVLGGRRMTWPPG